MRLAEVVAGQTSAPRALAVARMVGEAMGKQVIDAADIPGFIVNRCNRPFSLEALRLLQARVGSVEQIDRVARLAGGFRMGPFELMDLIGLDTSHAVAEGLYRQTYGEPRYQPSPLQARMIASGRLGRKTGAGWYGYGDGASAGPQIPRRPRAAVETVDAPHGPGAPIAARPHAVLTAGVSLRAIDPTAAGFHTLPPLTDSRLVEITSTPATDPEALARLRQLVTEICCVAETVGDAPGLVLGRIVCQLINEAAFLVGEGNGAPADVDTGMELGVNHPRGPVAWSREIGLAHVVAVLEGLHRELGEERYRVAPLLQLGVAIGAANFDEL
jgi:3-hydroxybutyryl-CoA dehydrogenase